MRVLFLLILITPRVSAQSGAGGCPIRIGSLSLRPARTIRAVVPASALGHNLERVLRINYKNVSGKDISGGEMKVVTSYYISGPTGTSITHGELSIPLERVRAGQGKTLRRKILTAAVPPQTWLQKVTFADGSHWTASNASQCAYVVHPGNVPVGTGVPGVY